MDIKEFLLAKNKNIKRHPWELARLKMLSFFIKQYKKPGAIADIGSGDAFLASEIARQYPDSTVMAIDINYTQELINEFISDYPKNLFFYINAGSITNNNKIDFVILMDVLEHIENPDMILNQIFDMPGVSPDTIFIITVPAYKRLYSQHDKNLGHYRRYNLRSLNKLLQPFTFKINRSGYCFNSLILFRLLRLFTEKITGNQKKEFKGIHNWKGGKWVTSLITTLFWIEFKISWYLAQIGIKLPGLSCYIICQPSPL